MCATMFYWVTLHIDLYDWYFWSKIFMWGPFKNKKQLQENDKNSRTNNCNWYKFHTFLYPIGHLIQEQNSHTNLYLCVNSEPFCISYLHSTANKRKLTDNHQTYVGLNESVDTHNNEWVAASLYVIASYVTYLFP